MAKPIHELQLNSCRCRQFIASLLARINHILNKNAVALGGVCHHHVRYRSDKLAVLDNRAARQECGQVGTTLFYNFLTVSTLLVKKIVLGGSILAYILTQTNAGKLFC